ncbi:coenzyme A pyrophosphatase [Halarchaeum grantii]|uniref:Coenzyme A pyrophosphatase n=1 Tax=Halarchaeum grantii TaxID=1193105 RepID=A0A830F2B5_9EURY|nr:CoA pyrophosphatase [Halarchaeum grantii]GGL32480.1 coenzyme A pyrophosphatase [Halarchaeum grantii]
MDFGRIAAHDPVAVTDAERDAAVLVPVIERADGPALLFTKRASHLGEHPGQMSFPGGGREPSDRDLTATALREAEEEIGLRSEEARVVGRLDDIHTVSRYSITPVVARVPDRAYDPDEREVAEIAVLSVAALTDPGNYELERREHPEFGELDVHFFHVAGYTVWGATGRILAQFLELAADWTPPERPDYVLDPDAEP